MSENIPVISAVDRYTAVLKNSRKSRLPPDYPHSQPPAAWPEENVALLERYLAWLIADGAGHTCIMQYYLPVAGHVLGYHLQPYEQLDISAGSIQALDTGLERAMDYLRAKRLSTRWLVMGRHALSRFRRFMRAERGLTEQPVTFKQANVAQYHKGLPAWLVAQITQYQHIRQANWRPARLNEAILRFWSGHTRLWRWLFAHYPIQAISDIKRAYVFAYMDERLAAGYSPKGVNQELRGFQATLRFLQDLTDEQVGLLRADLEQRGQQAETWTQQRNALLDRAAFYLLWLGGLRLGEVEELRLEDLNLDNKQLLIRQGKGCKERAVYLTATAVIALQAYLAVRGSGPTSHVFLFRHKPVGKDFIRGRMKAAGKRTGVKVTPHQLRHTYATQLVNAGCRITTIQALLGHQHLNTTMTYARVHDRTVAEDYFAAMAVVEKRLQPHLNPPPDQTTVVNGSAQKARHDGNGHLLALVDALNAGELGDGQRQLVTELRDGILALVA